MTAEIFLGQAGIPLLAFVVCVYYGIRLIIFRDISMIRGKNKGPVKDEKAYCLGAGKLILFFGGAALVMGLLVFVNIYAAFGEITVCTLIMGILWKRMNDKYGGK